jgi:hypothetical protein
MKGATLRRKIVESLRSQGFSLRHGRILSEHESDKETIRALHTVAVLHKKDKAKKNLKRYEDDLLASFANGSEVKPMDLEPLLVQVQPDSYDELLFRYAALHWRIPVSSGYGRRLRFLVKDRSNQKLVGIIGLGDPVFALGARDHWIGWDRNARIARLRNVMDAFVLGALPPYSSLLCGKLVAMLVASNEVRDAFRKKYNQRIGLISEEESDGRLALVTTMSALGRSSLYNRLKVGDELLFRSLGYSLGSGEFHFSNGLYQSIFDYANRYCTWSAKNDKWGSGPRNKREVIRKCLRKIKLDPDLVYHGVKREMYVVPLAKNAREFLRGEQNRLNWFSYSTADLFDWFRTRWLLPRAARMPEFANFNRESLRLWREE